MARKALLALGALCAISGGALAQQQQPLSYQWATGYGQGVLQAMIRSPDQSYVAFNCSNAEFQQGASISVEAHGRSLDGPKTLQLVVDGQSLSMPLLNGVANRDASVIQAAQAISASNARSFVAEIPELNWRQEFPLANARTVLTEPAGGTIVERCARR
ncbi:hypothetical protein [Roseococcus pinisoli]|uniref:Uncharacterized protein n=1 Tax=Roseococcus pinisoli TaxID=2835040 RepID=A0ABS5QGY9_9PROT|nr:hypothetical protein [Roseococcus pinisoli]MBS7812956.1 hypothetical protein [Roseococcus pinisoli]